jgi:hypothetical protein
MPPVLGTEPKEFYVWVDPEDFSVKHNVGLIGWIGTAQIPSDLKAEDLMFIFNADHKQGFMSRFHLGVMRNYSIEYELERFRSAYYPDYPSRLHAVYLWPDKKEAERYATNHKDHLRGRILKRGLTEGPYKYSIHDAAWIDFLRLGHSLEPETISACAHAYWTGARADQEGQQFSSPGKPWTPISAMEALLYGGLEFPNKSLVQSDVENNPQACSEKMTNSRKLQLASVIFALIAAVLGLWASTLEPLVIGSYWQPTWAAWCALASALLGIASLMVTS